MTITEQAPVRVVAALVDDPEFLMDFRRSLLRIVNVIDKHLAEREALTGITYSGKGGKPGS